MAKKEAKDSRSDDMTCISVEQLFEQTKNREVIPLTLSADIGLSGGIPLGATVLIGGRPKIGKTTVCLQYAANAQQLYNSEVYIFPPEGRLTHVTAKQARGFDPSRAKVIMPPQIHNSKGQVIGSKKWHAQQWWDAIGEVVSTKPRSIIILDSLSSLSSEKEQSEGMGYQGRGDTQKLEAQFCRNYGSLIISNEITFFVITQIQANTSGYGAATQLKVGNAIKHQADIVLFGKSSQRWDEENGRVYGHNMIYNVETSALGPPVGDIEIPLRYGYGVDNLKDIVTHAVNFEIIRKAGAWYTLPYIADSDPMKIVDIDKSVEKDEKLVKLQGEGQIRNWLLIHPEQANELEAVIREKVIG